MARPSSFGRDPGLQFRMLITMFLLGAIYVVLVAVIVASSAPAIALALVAGLFALQVFASDKLALRAVGAHEVSPQEAPELHAMIERLCVQADLPKPKIAIADTDMPNAFATGRSRRASTVCVTTGLLRLLEPNELEGVLAHELAHIQNRDVLIMTVASFFASIAVMVLQFAPFLGGGRDRDSGQPAFIVVMLVSVAVYLLSFVLMLALSRHREFVADRGAAVITGRPSALSSALMRISGAMRGIPDRDLRAAAEMNAFFIVPASVKGSMRTLLSTHPPIEQRIAALGRIEAAMQSGPARST
jgi:heat shock protein HtpX